MGASGWVHVDADEIKRETEKAFLVVIGDEECWLPKSQVDNASQYEAGDKDVTLSITEFIAREKGLCTS